MDAGSNMSFSQLNMTYDDLENEAYSDRSFGYFWTTMVEEVVRHVCVSKSFPPQSWGFPGYGPNEQEWAEADLIQLADWVINNRITSTNQHLTIISKVKDRSVSSVFRLLVQGVTWAVKDKRKNSVDANAVRLIKEILKDDFGITLKVTMPVSDPAFEPTVSVLVNLLKGVPQHWAHTASMTRRGTPRVNLPPVFKKTELKGVCSDIAKMVPLPASNQIWRAIQQVLPVRVGTQAVQRTESGIEQISKVGDLSEREEEITKIASKQGVVTLDSDDSLEKLGLGSLDKPIIEAINAFRSSLSGEEEVAMKVVMHPEFSHLPLMIKAQALEVDKAEEIELILKGLVSKSKKIAIDFSLNDKEMNEVTIMVGKSLLRDGEIW
jgi:hypothetical protein